MTDSRSATNHDSSLSLASGLFLAAKLSHACHAGSSLRFLPWISICGKNDDLPICQHEPDATQRSIFNGPGKLCEADSRCAATGPGLSQGSSNARIYPPVAEVHFVYPAFSYAFALGRHSVYSVMSDDLAFSLDTSPSGNT